MNRFSEITLTMVLEEENSTVTSATMACAKKRKLPVYDISHDPDYFAPKRYSPFTNTPKQRKEERRNIMKITAKKLKAIEDPEKFLRRSVLVNNQYRRLRKEMLDEKKYGYSCNAPLRHYETSVIVRTSSRPVSPVTEAKATYKSDHANNHLSYSTGLSYANVEQEMKGVEYNNTTDEQSNHTINVDNDNIDIDSHYSGVRLDSSCHSTHEDMSTDTSKVASSCPSFDISNTTDQVNSTPYDNAQDEKYTIKNTCQRDSDKVNQTSSQDEHSQTCLETRSSCNSSGTLSSSSDTLSERDRQILSGIDEIFNKLYGVLADVDSDLDKNSAMVTEVKVC